MNAHQTAEVCGRLRRILVIGLASAGIGALGTINSLGSWRNGDSWISGAGLLALLFGIGLILAAWIGYTIVGVARFRLRTLLIAVTLLSIVLAAWSATIGPQFFQATRFSVINQDLVIEAAGNANRGGFAVLRIPLFQIGLWIPMFFPLLLLPFVLRVPEQNPVETNRRTTG